MEFTHTDELNAIIDANAPKLKNELLTLYKEFIKDTERFTVGERYYMNETDILKQKVYVYEGQQKVVDEDATNERVPSGYHKILVDQKVGYLAGESMTFGSKTDNKRAVEAVQDILGEEWDEAYAEIVLDASNKGRAWLRLYVDEEGEFKFYTVGAEQVIPLYNSKTRGLEAVIYFYEYAEKHIKLEYWTKDDVTYYEIIGGTIVLDVTEPINPAPHFESGQSWGRVPFVKFANNRWEVSDLQFTKAAIDAYEKLVSKMQSTMIDIQDVIMVLKGYEGTNADEFMTNLRRFKMVKVGREGGVDTIKVEVPTAAYDSHSEKMRKTIITSGQGVDPSPDVIGDAPSGVSLEHLYSLLDMKASMFEQKAMKGLRELMYFISLYCEHSSTYDSFDFKDITFTTTKVTLTNEKEVVDVINSSIESGVLSEQTGREHHPYVKNADEETRRVEAQREADSKTLDVDTPPIMDEDDDETEV